MANAISPSFINVLPFVATQMEEKELIACGAVSEAVYTCVSSNPIWRELFYAETNKCDLLLKRQDAIDAILPNLNFYRLKPFKAHCLSELMSLLRRSVEAESRRTDSVKMGSVAKRLYELTWNTDNDPFGYGFVFRRYIGDGLLKSLYYSHKSMSRSYRQEYCEFPSIFMKALPSIAEHLDERGLIAMGSVSSAVYKCVSSDQFWSKRLYDEVCERKFEPEIINVLDPSYHPKILEHLVLNTKEVIKTRIIFFSSSECNPNGWYTRGFITWFDKAAYFSLKDSKRTYYNKVASLFVEAFPFVATQMDVKSLYKIASVSQAVYGCLSSDQFWEKRFGKLSEKGLEQEVHSLYIAREQLSKRLNHQRTFKVISEEDLALMRKIRPYFAEMHSLLDVCFIQDVKILQKHSKKNARFYWDDSLPAAEKNIRLLLNEGVDVQRNEWDVIHQICKPATIELMHARVSPLPVDERCGIVFCDLDYLKKAVLKNDPVELVKLKTAIGDYEDSEIILSLLEKVEAIDLDTLIISLKSIVEDAVLDELYTKFKATNPFQNTDCLAHSLVTDGFYEEPVILRMLQDMRVVQKAAVSQAVSRLHSAGIIVMAITKSEDFDWPFLLKILDLIKGRQQACNWSDGVDPVIEALVARAQPRDFSVIIRNCIIDKMNEKMILGLLERTDEIEYELLPLAIKYNSSFDVISVIADKADTISDNTDIGIPKHVFWRAYEDGKIKSMERHFHRCGTVTVDEFFEIAEMGVSLEVLEKMRKPCLKIPFRAKNSEIEMRCATSAILAFQDPDILLARMQEHTDQNRILNLLVHVKEVDMHLIHFAIMYKQSVEVIAALVRKCPEFDEQTIEKAMKYRLPSAVIEQLSATHSRA